jgi:hypothetical protein
LATASSDSKTLSHSKQLNFLTIDQEFILEAIKRLDDLQLQKSYLDKILNNFKALIRAKGCSLFGIRAYWDLGRESILKVHVYSREKKLEV